MIFKSGKGCLLCNNSDWAKKFELTKGKKDYYSGCKKDVKEVTSSCKDKSESLSCFKELNKEKINYTTYYKDNKFYLEVLDKDLKKFIKNDKSIKSLKIIPKNNPCTISESYKTVIDPIELSKNGLVVLKFEPDKACRAKLSDKENKVTEYELTKENEKDKTGT